jgi:hypothetical protein
MTTETKFYCCSEWHLARLSPICSLVYPLALRLSKTHGGMYTYSAKSVAEFLGYDEWTVRELAYKKLAKLGFFILVEKGLFEANAYQVLTHKEWAVAHPNQCAIKTEYVWTGEGDKLGQDLYVVSGAQVKFKEHQIKFLRSLGLPEDKIRSEFAMFWTEQSSKSHANQFKSNRNALIGRFILHMKAVAKTRAVAA